MSVIHPGAGKYLKDINYTQNIGLRLIRGVYEKIIEADSGKKLMRAQDGSHLNGDREKIVAEWLAEWYQKEYGKQ